MNRTARRPAVLVVIALGLVASACSSGDKQADSTTTTQARGSVVNAQVASYDLAAGRPQRFIVGLLTNDNDLLVGGEVGIAFKRVGFGAKATPTATAKFLPVADAPAIPDGPRLREADESVGVYVIEGIVFDEPGNWEVAVIGNLDGKRFGTKAAFPVAAKPALPAPGDPAPRTENLMPGATDAPPKAIDSRADAAGKVPDSALHQMTVAAALATRKPTVVVVSTPVYCVSQFCGPITDTVETIAGEFAGKANFVHIEVWRDFEKKQLNRHAAEWMYPNGADEAREPFVFLVDANGTIVQRWDNVANGGVIRAALDQVIA